MSTSELVSVSDFERYARTHWDKDAINFFNTGANREETLNDNVAAFKRYKLRPRVLRDISKPDLKTTLLGMEVEMPICVAPTSRHKMVHPEGEIATAKASAAVGSCYVLSSASSCSLEELSDIGGLKWFQMYIGTDREKDRAIIQKAEKMGCGALVITVDGQVQGYRTAMIREPSKTIHSLRLPILDEQAVEYSNIYAVSSKNAFDMTLSWTDIRWLKDNVTSLPIVLKGIMTAEDAALAVRCGVDAIIVSNHGGRQLDGVAATLDVVEEVIGAVDGKCEVYMDGGIRSGIDVIKALALGVKTVFIGRPVLWGLAYKGEEGVIKVLNILKEELRIAMQLLGSNVVGNFK